MATVDSCLNFWSVPINKPNIRRFLKSRKENHLSADLPLSRRCCRLCSKIADLTVLSWRILKIPLLSLFIHILILDKVSPCTLFGGSYNWRLQCWLQEKRKLTDLTAHAWHAFKYKVCNHLYPPSSKGTLQFQYLFNIIILWVALLAWFSSCPTLPAQPAITKINLSNYCRILCKC